MVKSVPENSDVPPVEEEYHLLAFPLFPITDFKVNVPSPHLSAFVTLGAEGIVVNTLATTGVLVLPSHPEFEL